MTHRKLYIQDVTLRDGMHAIRHRITPDRRRATSSRALDAAGVDAIEVAHGDGLAGGSLNYGPGAHTDWEWIEAAADAIAARDADHAAAARHRHDRTTCERAYDLGVRSVRVATHCTEADVSAQHIAAGPRARHGRLRLPDDEPHGPARRRWPQQAKLMESYGAHCVYVTDSGGRLTMDGVRDRVRAYRDVLDPATEIGIHAHENLSLSRGQLGRRRRGAASPGSTPRWPGRAPAPATARSRRSSRSPTCTGWEHGCDLFALQDAADDLVRPLQDRPGAGRPRDPHPRLRRRLLQLPAPRRGGRRSSYGVDVRDILVEVGAGGWSAARRT